MSDYSVAPHRVRRLGSSMGKSEDLFAMASTGKSMPLELSVLEQCLWLAKAGQWHQAHDLCADVAEPAGSWIHAYLHREEGDLGNAAYWYSRANKPVPSASLALDEELNQIARALLD